MAVAAAVLTTTEGEDVGTVDTAAAVTSEAGGTPTVARTRYEFDLPWTPEEEQKLAEASSLNPGLVSGCCHQLPASWILLLVRQLLPVVLPVSSVSGYAERQMLCTMPKVPLGDGNKAMGVLGGHRHRLKRHNHVRCLCASSC